MRRPSARRSSARSGPRSLDRAEQLLQLVGGVPNPVGELVDHVERALVLANLQELVDEVLAGLQAAQKLGEIPARAVELADRTFGRRLQLAPALDQELLVFRLVARLLIERLELRLRAAERLLAEARD